MSCEYIKVRLLSITELPRRKMLAQRNEKLDLIVSDTTEIRAMGNQQMKEQRQNKFQSWISAPNTHEDHTRICGEMVSGSGSWVLDTPQICDWRSREEPGIVWIHGGRKFKF